MTEEDINILIYNVEQLTEVVSEDHQSIKKLLKRTDKLERFEKQQSRAFFLLCGLIFITGMIEMFIYINALS